MLLFFNCHLVILHCIFPNLVKYMKYQFSSIFFPFSVSLSLIVGWIHLARFAVYYVNFVTCRGQQCLYVEITENEDLVVSRHKIR